MAIRQLNAGCIRIVHLSGISRGKFYEQASFVRRSVRDGYEAETRFRVAIILPIAAQYIKLMPSSQIDRQSLPVSSFHKN